MFNHSLALPFFITLYVPLRQPLLIFKGLIAKRQKVIDFVNYIVLILFHPYSKSPIIRYSNLVYLALFDFVLNKIKQSKVNNTIDL